MPNNSQNALLDSLIAIDGCHFETIRDNKAFDLGTKILYLERAIDQPCATFNESLNKLYNPNLADQSIEKTANIDFIRALKVINDLCYNNEVKYGDNGTKKALDHYFSVLGDINEVEFKKYVTKIIKEGILALSKGHEETVTKQKQAREIRDSICFSSWRWRKELDLPEAQQNQRNFIYASAPGPTPQERAQRALVERNWSETDAQDACSNLTQDEAFGVLYGLLPSDVGGLYYFHILALIQLKAHGITRDDLDGQDWFTSRSHIKLLIKKIVQDEMKPNIAMNEIRGLTERQALAVLYGLRHGDVAGLDDAHVDALVMFSAHGLTREHIHDKSWLTSVCHMRLLRLLLVDQEKSPDVAMGEIDNLTTNQADEKCKAIAMDLALGTEYKQLVEKFAYFGITKDEIKNFHQLKISTFNHYLNMFGDVEKYISRMSVIDKDKADTVKTAVKDFIKISTSENFQKLLEALKTPSKKSLYGLLYSRSEKGSHLADRISKIAISNIHDENTRVNEPRADIISSPNRYQT